LAEAVRYTLETLGRPPRTREEIRSFIGDGVRRLLADALGSDEASVVDQAMAIFPARYLDHCADRSRLYPGVAETLTRLSSMVKMAVVTNKPEAPSRKLMDQLGISGRFSVLIGGDTLLVRKPDPEPVREALRRLGVAASEAVFVGDSPGDVAAAHAAGVRVVGVTYGYRSAEKLRAAGADVLIDAFSDLVSLLRSTDDAAPRIGSISVGELKSKMDAGVSFVLLDVREPNEFDLCSLPGTVLIPLGDLPSRMGELDAAADVVVYCRSGMRSQKAIRFLAAHGFRQLTNVTGGILAWADEIDPSMPKY
jgi:phosphoglycolate phosphatase